MPADLVGRREQCVILGFGQIGRLIARRLAQSSSGPELAAIVARNPAAAESELGRENVPVHASLSDVLGNADIVVECASPEVLALSTPDILRSGADLLALSLSAFAEPQAEERLRSAIDAGPGRFYVPSGAACALTLLRVAHQAGLSKVHFRQIYPPAAWQRIAKAISHEHFIGSFFHGSVRKAAQLFPRHLNAATGVALSGLGLDDTTVELIGDPDIKNMRYELEIDSMGTPIRLTVGPYQVGPLDRPDHTAFSVLSMLEQRSARLSF